MAGAVRAEVERRCAIAAAAVDDVSAAAAAATAATAAQLTRLRAPIRPPTLQCNAPRRCTHVGCRPYHHICPPLRRTEDPHPPIPTLRAWCGLWEGGEGRALVVYRYVWRDDLSDTFDESVRV